MHECGCGGRPGAEQALLARRVPARARLAIGAALIGLPLLGLSACQATPAAATEPEPHFKGDPAAPITVVEWGDFQ